MQTQDVFYSEEFHQELGNQRISLLMTNILLGFTAIVANTVILIALHKETSLNQASKVLLRNLVASDLCVGFLQLVVGALFISTLQGRWQACRLLFFVSHIEGIISITVSLWTITAISVDRLLALLLKLRYRQVVTVRKVYAVAIASWICNGIGSVPLWYFSPDVYKLLFVITIAVCLTTSTYCYTRIFSRLRRQHTQVHNNLREPENQTTRVDRTRYRKTVFSALWLQLALLFCYLPYLLLMPFVHRKFENDPSSAFYTPLRITESLMLFNSTLNPILCGWRIKEIRRALKDSLSCSRT